MGLREAAGLAAQRPSPMTAIRMARRLCTASSSLDLDAGGFRGLAPFGRLGLGGSHRRPGGRRDPLSGLELGEHADPAPPEGWTTVTVRAAALNHHDVWSLRGVGLPADRLPMILGCDAAGVDEDGRDVVVHAVIGDPAVAGGDETLDPRRSLLSASGTTTWSFAERLAAVTQPGAQVRRADLQAGRLPADRLPDRVPHAVRPRRARARRDHRVQGAGGGVATALILLGRAAGFRVWATSRSEAKRARSRCRVFPLRAFHNAIVEDIGVPI